MLCQQGPIEHVMQQSPRRPLGKPAQQRPSPAANEPQSPISFILRPVSQTIKTQVMSFFNSIGYASSSSCQMTRALTRIPLSLSCVGVLCNARAPEGPNAPQLQPRLHLPVLLPPTICLLRPHQCRPLAPKSPYIFAVRSSRPHSSREISRRS